MSLFLVPFLHVKHAKDLFDVIRDVKNEGDFFPIFCMSYVELRSVQKCCITNHSTMHIAL